MCGREEAAKPTAESFGAAWLGSIGWADWYCISTFSFAAGILAERVSCGVVGVLCDERVKVWCAGEDDGGGRKETVSRARVGIPHLSTGGTWNTSFDQASKVRLRNVNPRQMTSATPDQGRRRRVLAGSSQVERRPGSQWRPSPGQRRGFVSCARRHWPCSCLCQ